MGFTAYWDAEKGMLTMTPPKPEPPLTKDELRELNEELAPFGYVAAPVAVLHTIKSAIGTDPNSPNLTESERAAVRWFSENMRETTNA